MAVKTESLHPSWNYTLSLLTPSSMTSKRQKTKKKYHQTDHIYTFLAKRGGEPTYTKRLEKSVNDENLTSSQKKERKRQEEKKRKGNQSR